MGDSLRNGARLISYAANPDHADGVVMAEWLKDGKPEFIVWSVFRHEADSTCWGHYFRDMVRAGDKFREKKAQYRAEMLI